VEGASDVLYEVIAAEVVAGDGRLAHEPVTRATLRDSATGGLHHVRIVGGATRQGFTYLAGHVVPGKGMRVPLDLKLKRHGQRSPFSGGASSWIPNTNPAALWKTLPVSFVLALPGTRALSEADAAAELDVATRTWSGVACSSFRANVTAPRASLTPSNDGVNGVFFHDDAWPAELIQGALGQTVVHLDPSGNLRDTDIHINSADFRITTDASNSTQDLRGVFVHEIGHALGLGHSPDARATMSVSSSGLRWRSLEKDDVEGVCALYPGVTSLAASCDPACPPDFVCVGGACQRRGERANLCSPCPPGDLGTACEAAGDDARCVDLPNSGGRVCGRPCARNEDCGEGFLCQPTSEAGDRQCLSQNNCQNGANTCATDADCTESKCRAGVCAGEPTNLPTIQDAGVESSTTPPSTPGGGGDCDCNSIPTRTERERAQPVLFIAAVLAACYRRRRRN